MKSTDIKIAIVLVVNAILAIVFLTCCNDNSPARMMWTVTSQDKDNVEVTFNPDSRPQIEIVANAQGGQCTISCPNFKHISFREKRIRTNIHEDQDCQFHAKITNQGVITVNFDKMPQEDHEISTFFIIDGDHDDQTGTTVVKVTRKLQKLENFQ